MAEVGLHGQDFFARSESFVSKPVFIPTLFSNGALPLQQFSGGLQGILR